MKIGLVRLAVLRSTPVFALVNIAMVAYLFIESAGWSYWYFAVVGFVGLWVWLDMKFIWKSEINETFSRSEDIQELKKSIKAIETYLNAEGAGAEADEWSMASEYERGLMDGRLGHE